MRIKLDETYAERGLTTITCNGIFDTFYCPEFIQTLENIAERKKRPLAVSYDLFNVQFLNSTALGAMLKGRKYLRRKDIGTYLLDPMGPLADRVVRGIGIDNVIPVKTLDEILQEISG